MYRDHWPITLTKQITYLEFQGNGFMTNLNINVPVLVIPKHMENPVTFTWVGSINNQLSNLDGTIQNHISNLEQHVQLRWDHNEPYLQFSGDHTEAYVQPKWDITEFSSGKMLDKNFHL